jgi:hypothetical protein
MLPRCRPAVSQTQRAAGETAGRVSRLATQRNVPLVYFDYIESAPWNIKLLAEAGGQKTRTMIAPHAISHSYLSLRDAPCFLL